MGSHKKFVWNLESACWHDALGGHDDYDLIDTIGNNNNNELTLKVDKFMTEIILKKSQRSKSLL
jgi:hypothetical protein